MSDTRLNSKNVVNLRGTVARYFPPARLLLARLGISAADLLKDRVTVNASGLRRLIAEYAKTIPLDAVMYARANPDVEGAKLAGDIVSLEAHFVSAGYLEGRLPGALPFDPVWYHGHYKDINAMFALSDVQGLYNHFMGAGFVEGRSGCAEFLGEAGEWSAD